MSTQKPFETRVRRLDGAAILDMQGEINSFAEEALNSAYAEAAAPQPDRIMLNFSGVSYINSTGIALIVGLLAQARKSHIEMVSFGLSEHYREIFHITRLSDFMTIVPDEAAATAPSG
jgi:anti-sigma B factor antagonist